MLKLECASLKGLLECASFSIVKGEICEVLTETDFDRNLLLKVFTGLAALDSGKIYIFDKDILSITSAELNETRKRIGVVLNNGGLISNLKVWENLMLPLAYHMSFHKQDIEEKIRVILSKIGYDDDLNVLPGPLPDYKKRLIGFARAMLMDPDMIIYDSVFEGLSSDSRSRVLETVNAFHLEKKGRVSLFLDPGESPIRGIKADNTYRLKEGKFYEGN
ncbi:MAG: ATP-binding cassette domain-containing protein [Nitrospirae bacterium]|nr:ATP-binding cassette domain-containing protein [Nitrospirota bacterium]